MSADLQITLVAVAAGIACALVGVFLVLRRLAMMADAISHSILPGIVAGYVLAQGPNLLFGFLGAAASGLATVVLVEALSKGRLKQDAAIGLVFPVLFALGVLVVSKFYANVHIDTDAVLYGEIAFAPFDTLSLAGRDLGPKSFWVLAALAAANAGFIGLLYKELKLATFDPGLAGSLGFRPTLLHYLLMALVAVTTVGAFSAVGAILSVALIIVPPVVASLLTQRLPAMIGISLAVGALGAILGHRVAALGDVSISGMIATMLGLLFALALLFSPGRGLVAQWVRRRGQRSRFAIDMLLVHLAAHQDTPSRDTECALPHLVSELGWEPDRAMQVVGRAERHGLVARDDSLLLLTESGRRRAALAAPP
jgi:manganese/zinc/iron transport system permease protein